MLLVFLRTSGVLFHIERPIKGSVFCPMLLFRKRQINFRYLFLVIKLFEQANSKTSFRELRHCLVKYLKIIEFMDWLNLSLTGNPLRVWNSFLEIWVILSSCRQYQMYLFSVVWILFFIFWVRLGYQADDA